MKKLSALRQLAKTEPQAHIYQKMLFNYAIFVLTGLAALITCIALFHYTVGFSVPRFMIQAGVIVNFIAAISPSINLSHRTLIEHEGK